MGAEYLSGQNSIERRICRVKGLNVSYLGYGSGAPVIMLPGWPFGSEMYKKAIPFFDHDKFKIHALDLPGWEETDLPGEKLDYASLSLFVRDFLDANGIKKADVVGVSFGAALALNFSRYHPGRVNRLVVNSPPVVFSEHLTTLQKVAAKASENSFVKSAIYKAMMSKNEALWSALFRTPPKVDDDFKLAVVEQTCNAKFRALDEVIQQILKTDLREVLAQVNKQTLVITGDEDYLFYDSVMAAKSIPGALFVMVEAGHDFCVTHPQEFAHQVSRFLEE